MRQVEFLVRLKTRAGKVGGAGNRGDGCETLEAATAIEEVALGVQKSLGVEAHLHMFLAQEGDQVFDQPQGLFVKALFCQVTDESFDRPRASFAQSKVGACFRFVTEPQAEVAEAVETFTQELPATDVEVGGGDVERVAFMIGQEVVENVGHFVPLVVDDERDGHSSILLIS